MKVFAHTISVSRSELRTDEGITRLEIHLPIAELDHIPQAERALASRFQVNGEPPVSQACEFSQEEYICKATFLVSVPETVVCDLASVVVPHHVHTMQTPGGAFVFTNMVTEQKIEHRAMPWWIAGLFILLLLISIRQWRRRTLRRG